MNILLDTHIILWSLSNNPKLPLKAKELILNSENEIFFSVVSLWEIEIKRLMKPDFINLNAEEISELCIKSGYNLIPLREKAIYTLQSLKRHETEPPHKDPFDRILLCQAISENMSFLTHDSLIKGYDSKSIIFV